MRRAQPSQPRPSEKIRVWQKAVPDTISATAEATAANPEADEATVPEPKNLVAKLADGTFVKRWYRYGDELVAMFGQGPEIYRCERCQILYWPNESEAAQRCAHLLGRGPAHSLQPFRGMALQFSQRLGRRWLAPRRAPVWALHPSVVCAPLHTVGVSSQITRV